jgi:hypothetical protein
LPGINQEIVASVFEEQLATTSTGRKRLAVTRNHTQRDESTTTLANEVT